MLRALAVVVLGLASGLLAALIAVGFVAAMGWLNDVLLVSPRSRMMFEHRGWLMGATVLVPAGGGLVVGLLLRHLAEGRAHGPAEAIAAVQTGRGGLSPRAGTVSALSSLVSLGSGASVGQYGPLVHIGASLGSALARLSRAARSDDNIAIASGVAAAISTAFNAPLAGILFAHEVVLRHYALRAFAPVAAASSVGYIVAAVVFERRPLFHVEAAAVNHAWEYVAFMAIGVGGALVAVAYMHAILGATRLAPRVPLPVPLRPALAGAAVGVAALWVPDILGIGKETLRFAIIEGAYSGGELGLILVVKLLATALCLGLGFAGGVFSPALVIGTLFGALCGTGLEWVAGAERGPLAMYGVAGMVAVTAPVIGAPLTTVVIVFELTHNYTLTTAALASVVLANLVASRLFGRSLFDVQLRARGMDLSSGRGKLVLELRKVGELVTRDCVTVEPAMTVREVMASLAESDRGEAYVVDAQGRYRGTLTLARLQAHADPGAGVGELARDDRPLLSSDTGVWDAMEHMQDFVGEAVPVVEPGGAGFVGVVHETALMKVYLGTLDALRREEHG
ncbi:MAG: chloride channel protein [Gammaproteobacteria bacterium]|nr:chloride channel protein [Gammaproteobacteria bacterium]NIR81625.1 chloride channel protein [Gammaproteobacteria bacterium]NIR88176.1 chloride channel protein [Gammaproteobacteria bacterium]NIU02737.1 chloride channel protein [Gammaproteobacteria bacterium]NIV73336.1 CBS domain-containing protein [Gammaproteobacteria bacterium]